jgi:hypothetical protein
MRFKGVSQHSLHNSKGQCSGTPHVRGAYYLYMFLRGKCSWFFLKVDLAACA